MKKDTLFSEILAPQLQLFGCDSVIIEDVLGGYKVFYFTRETLYCPFFKGSKQKIFKSLKSAYEAAHLVLKECHPGNRPFEIIIRFPT